MVEIVDDGLDDEKDCVLLHKREWLMRPSEIIVHYIKQSFTLSSCIVELYDLLVAQLPIVGQNAAMSIPLLVKHIFHACILGCFFLTFEDKSMLDSSD